MRRLPDWLGTYLQFTEHSEAPEHFHFWVGVATIAAALRRKVYIDQVDFTWTPNFFIVLVTRPGLTKSTAIHKGKNLVADLGTIKLGPDATTWQGMIKLHSETSELVPMPDGSFLQMSCVSYFSSELGSLLNFTDPQMIDVMCDLWDGRKGFSKITAHCGSPNIGHPWVNIIAATTPAWLSSNLPQSMIAGGFVARCIFLHAAQKRRLVAYPKRLLRQLGRPIPKDDLLGDLEKISMLKGEFEITEAAMDWGEQWYIDLNKQMSSSPSEEWQAYLGRKQTHVHKVAMALSASESDRMVIEPEHLRLAVDLVTSVEGGLPEIFRCLHSTQVSEKVFSLADIVRSRGAVPLSQLYRVFFSFHSMPYKEFEELLNSALQAGILVQTTKNAVVFVQVP